MHRHIPSLFTGTRRRHRTGFFLVQKQFPEGIGVLGRGSDSALCIPVGLYVNLVPTF